MIRPRPVLAALCCVAVLLSVGCLSLADDSIPEDVQQRLEGAEPPETVTGVQNLSYEFEDGAVGDEAFEDGEVVVTQRVWYSADGRSRVVLNGSQFGDSGSTITVNDGEKQWTYTPEENTVRVTNATDLNSNVLAQYYNVTSEMFAQLEVTSANETTVDGRDAYYIVFEPSEEDDTEDVSVLDAITNPLSPLDTGSGDDGDDSSLGISSGPEPDRAELWLDQEYLFPLRSVIETPNGTVRLSFRDVEFEADVPAERFEFEPPENATVEAIDLPDVQRYDDVEAADEDAPFAVTEPAFVPEGYDLDRVSVTEFAEENRTAASLFYQSDERSFLTVDITDGEPQFGGDGEAVDVDGKNGTYSTSETVGSQRLFWECNGLQYTVIVITDDTIDREDVLRIAESIDC